MEEPKHRKVVSFEELSILMLLSLGEEEVFDNFIKAVKGDKEEICIDDVLEFIRKNKGE